MKQTVTVNDKIYNVECYHLFFNHPKSNEALTKKLMTMFYCVCSRELGMINRHNYEEAYPSSYYQIYENCIKNFNGITVCILFDPKNPENTEYKFTRPSSFGVSFCSKSDNFNKKTGRKIALGRAKFFLDCPIMQKICTNDVFMEQLEYKINENIEERRKLCNHVRKD